MIPEVTFTFISESIREFPSREEAISSLKSVYNSDNIRFQKSYMVEYTMDGKKKTKRFVKYRVEERSIKYSRNLATQGSDCRIFEIIGLVSEGALLKLMKTVSSNEDGCVEHDIASGVKVKWRKTV